MMIKTVLTISKRLQTIPHHAHHMSCCCHVHDCCGARACTHTICYLDSQTKNAWNPWKNDLSLQNGHASELKPNPLGRNRRLSIKIESHQCVKKSKCLKIWPQTPQEVIIVRRELSGLGSLRGLFCMSREIDRAVARQVSLLMLLTVGSACADRSLTR